jgi:hypothetical protein
MQILQGVIPVEAIEGVITKLLVSIDGSTPAETPISSGQAAVEAPVGATLVAELHRINDHGVATVTRMVKKILPPAPAHAPLSLLAKAYLERPDTAAACGSPAPPAAASSANAAASAAAEPATAAAASPADPPPQAPAPASPPPPPPAPAAGGPQPA